MNKQEKVREEWVKIIGIDKYNLIKNSICENGTIYEYILRELKIYSNDFLFKNNGDNEPDECQLRSLQGIENNNGWIKIESEDDLPKDNWINMFIVINKNGHISLNGFGRNRKKLWLSTYTHYQPIQKPEPQIY